MISCSLLVYFSIFLLSTLFACQERTTTINPEGISSQEEVQQLKKFYYPIDSLGDGMVYEYVDEQTGSTVGYWHYNTIKDEAGNRYLIGSNYSPFFEQEQFSREWIVATGTILKDYQFIQLDSISMKSVIRPAKIEESVVLAIENRKNLLNNLFKNAIEAGKNIKNFKNLKFVDDVNEYFVFIFL